MNVSIQQKAPSGQCVSIKEVMTFDGASYNAYIKPHLQWPGRGAGVSAAKAAGFVVAYWAIKTCTDPSDANIEMAEKCVAMQTTFDVAKNKKHQTYTIPILTNFKPVNKGDELVIFCKNAKQEQVPVEKRSGSEIEQPIAKKGKSKGKGKK